MPWDGDAQSEIDAFVSEELYVSTSVIKTSMIWEITRCQLEKCANLRISSSRYIHTKMCIADDRKVRCDLSSFLYVAGIDSC